MEVMIRPDRGKGRGRGPWLIGGQAREDSALVDEGERFATRSGRDPLDAAILNAQTRSGYGGGGGGCAKGC